MQQTQDIHKMIRLLLAGETELASQPPSAAGQLRHTLAQHKLELAAALLEQAAYDLADRHEPTQTSELIVIARRVQKINEKLSTQRVPIAL